MSRNSLASLAAVIILVLCLIGAARIQAASLDETIRVAIVKAAQQVTVSGDGLLVTGEDGEPLTVALPATVSVADGCLQLAGRTYHRLSFSASTAVYVNGKPYRGLAELTVADKGVLVVNQLPLDEYLVGLINCEISSAWPIEAVKAQAIIARTYAMSRKLIRVDAPYHLESSVIDQVYDGCLLEDSRAHRAVYETAGEVLTFNGAVIQAFYHSSCGGRTEAAGNVWGNTVSYLKGVECQYCLAAPASVLWEARLPLKDIEERLRNAGHRLSGLVEVKAGALNSRGRLKQVIMTSPKGNVTVSGEQFRKAVGYGVIKSTKFSVKSSKNDVVFSGSGNGHGVGLCQWGAKQRALDGFNSGEILSYYYPGSVLKKLSDIR